MASWSTPTIHVTGDIFSVSDNNILANNETFLYQRPYATLFNSSATSIPDSADTQVTLGGGTSAYGFTVSGNNAILPLDGSYQITCSVAMGIATGPLKSSAWIEGTPALQGSTVDLSLPYQPQSVGGGIVVASAGDTVGLYAYQNSGGSQNTLDGFQYTYLHIAYLGAP